MVLLKVDDGMLFLFIKIFAFIYIIFLVMHMMYRGRHPWEIALARYPHDMPGRGVVTDHLRQVCAHLKLCLFQKEYLDAHTLVHRHTDWVNCIKPQVAPELVLLWYKIHNKVNRIRTICGWEHYPESDSQLGELRQETLLLIEQMLTLLPSPCGAQAIRELQRLPLPDLSSHVEHVEFDHEGCTAVLQGIPFSLMEDRRPAHHSVSGTPSGEARKNDTAEQAAGSSGSIASNRSDTSIASP